ncbi:MAG: type IV pilus assembly protein PilM [Candidatus Sungbacteria bacterium]|uniref:Type IV pilus assembly protein PilM n=1 Tax=Candidatus Sungiibacteriota bacterium TaxID=2750080 RepID=A0A932YZ49_9BACT|nr:type IV pilus assembly protein PilM [Candidatus Sungbacteria bacterium]
MFRVLTNRILHPPTFGIDISDLAIKFSRLVRRGEALLLDYFGETVIPAGIVISGEIVKPAELAAILKNELKPADGRRVRERYCIASLPEEKSFVRLIDLPSIKPEDIPKAMRWEVEGVVPMPFDQIFFDYEPLPPLPGMGEHRDVLLIAFPRNIVESYHRALSDGGLIPLALELESQAISRSLIRGGSVQPSFLLVDIGAARTSFIIFGGGSLIFTKSISVGGRDFESAIAREFGVPPEEARQIKIEAGLNKNYRDGRVLSALLPHLAVITAELEQELVFYRDHPAKLHTSLGQIERVVLCGGDANLIGLPRYLASVIKRPVVLGDPFVNFKLAPGAIPPIPKNQSLKYTTAIGLALRAAGY